MQCESGASIGAQCQREATAQVGVRRGSAVSRVWLCSACAAHWQAQSPKTIIPIEDVQGTS